MGKAGCYLKQTSDIHPLYQKVIVNGISLTLFKHRSEYRQNKGEALVSSNIRRLVKGPYHLFNNVTLNENGHTTQIDHILVTQKKIIVIETKHYSGWIFGSPISKYWQQSIYRYKSKFLNPILQNQRHIKFLSKLFNLDQSYYKNLVVFSGDSEFKTEVGINVINLNSLSKHINEDTDSVINEKMMTYIVGRIEMHITRQK